MRPEPLTCKLPRGPELVQAQLAVARAGAAFLPLDLESPDPRLKACLGLAQPAASRLLAEVERIAGGAVIGGAVANSEAIKLMKFSAS